MLVSGLGSVRQIEALEMLDPYLKDPSVQTEAALAVFEIAPALIGTAQAPKLKRMLDQIVATTKDADVRKTAAKLTRGMQTGAKKGKAR